MARSIDQLPHWIEPSRDLWPGIAARIEAEQSAQGKRSASPPRTGMPRWIAGLALASLAVIAVGLYWRTQEASQSGTTLQAGLPAEAQLGVDQSLATLRSYRIQIEAALAEDAGNPELQSMLAENFYEESRVMLLVADAGLSAGVF